ncbi:MAG: DUF1211 domain-containing protein [Acidobacteria bacterium]|nr:DUF1211 domain-containing protein [Acidobacteriota bacterium]
MPSSPHASGPSPPAVPEKETGRIEAFSDGVFAIAITLLILDIRVPRPPADEAAAFDLGGALLHLWPSLLAFVMSFAIVLVMWVNHHRIFTVVRRSDDAFLFWNGLLLMAVTFVPFPTALLAEYMGEGTHEQLRLAAIVYSGHGLLSALAFTGVWRHAIRRGRLLTPGHMEAEVQAMSAQYRWGPLAYATAFVVSVVAPWVGILICFGMAAAFSIRGFMSRR